MEKQDFGVVVCGGENGGEEKEKNLMPFWRLPPFIFARKKLTNHSNVCRMYIQDN
ncbi:MAG: hypothetical protein GY765_19885 [bacterium]|nr:hypothetical protein [bacterium]